MKTQRYRAYILKDARLPQLMEAGVGGFLILHDGKVAAVGYEQHYRAYKRHYNVEYGCDARNHGCVRISFCGAHDQQYVTFSNSAAIPALMSLRRMMRAFLETRPRIAVEVEGYPYVYESDLDINDALRHVNLVTTARRLADREAAVNTDREAVPALLP